ncbi:hypothetical protein Gasu2_31130 [Galdieria sulphuraria]|uniref:Uncharacterized protein n=1 Tax=Galdieria sulphuraria TaxID=130081 RepID=M2Y6U0_GALSU|nr:uncharacterized protein Gasu_12410 [Galdieria sulphuraria]EME31569.1 hypothetical protein Gasu_12410 [Galdieria sulphuraria]GJD08829.1 hypothetical protein Gasu2_31130 [Galdieria sulphuraria]|eukprot:XP_005708089.1 hypothetical protein Gasu_12410 [Galdieria sulphuraria]
MWSLNLQNMEEYGDEDGCVTPTSQAIRVSLDRPPSPPKKRHKKPDRIGKNLEFGKSKYWRNSSSEVRRYSWSGKCSSCGELSKLRPGRTICFRLDCALHHVGSKLD